MIKIGTPAPRRLERQNLPRYHGRPDFVYNRDRWMFNRLWYSWASETGCCPGWGDGALYPPSREE